MDDVLRVDDLHKSFGKGHQVVHANAGVSMEARAGQVVALLGHNGAGKTTLVNQIVGLMRPDGGEIRVAGVDAVASPAMARRLCSVQAQANVPISGLTPLRAIELVGRIRGGDRRLVRARAASLIEGLALAPWARTKAEKVSGGVARLTAFAMCAVVPGRLVILDEPTNDVDPVRRRLLWTQIRRLADDGAAVLLVTHNVAEAASIIDRLVVLDRGRVIAAGTPAGVVAEHAPGASLEDAYIALVGEAEEAAA
ncbi:MAG: ABC transporter ATP-binding protein [Acidipropionibacterium sp.]|jgi:ABC-2 type transport system ATP-binding protein|nr:ABC transporter ATP-binding protein [Acidipropionibacterium sp.]